MKSITISDGILEIFFIRCPDSAVNFFTEKLESDSSNQFKTKQITLTNNCFEFEACNCGLELWRIQYVDKHWSQFVKEHTKESFSITGISALALWRQYCSWGIDLVANQAICSLKNGEITFQELNVLAPYLQDHQAIQEFATKALFHDTIPRKNGTPRKGTIQPDNVQELIAWVLFYRGMNAMTIEDATAHAIESHPDLIPEAWADPYGSLERAYKRYEKHRPQF